MNVLCAMRRQDRDEPRGLRTRRLKRQTAAPPPLLSARSISVSIRPGVRICGKIFASPILDPAGK